ncbi:hypothetical protein chiPu_0005665 [Chiloscyllium punctatum]|uniref:Uncharacterized protein n=1 Tax=Chiloscyllium punctatum TaxID=137246 RepID=A0A401SA10_CHIPU|nr:hypothetical protein [Chiloscyllium punctatum]
MCFCTSQISWHIKQRLKLLIVVKTNSSCFASRSQSSMRSATEHFTLSEMLPLWGRVFLESCQRTVQNVRRK